MASAKASSVIGTPTVPRPVPQLTMSTHTPRRRVTAAPPAAAAAAVPRRLWSARRHPNFCVAKPTPTPTLTHMHRHMHMCMHMLMYTRTMPLHHPHHHPLRVPQRARPCPSVVAPWMEGLAQQVQQVQRLAVLRLHLLRPTPPRLCRTRSATSGTAHRLRQLTRLMRASCSRLDPCPRWLRLPQPAGYHRRRVNRGTGEPSIALHWVLKTHRRGCDRTECCAAAFVSWFFVHVE